MDFAALPPEINSARMYGGPGAAPMMAAGSAWSALGSELSTAASSYESVISMLTGEEWLGPASTAMAAAVAPYVTWMTTTAAAAERAASQAIASAAAFESAFAMTVPPPVIAANRAQLAALVATNIIGQNTPAIAANEALYGEMWAQDAAAMYGYAGTSATAGVLTPLAAPVPTTNPTGLAGQAVAVTQASTASTQSGLTQLVAGLPSAVQGLASPLAAADASGVINSLQVYGTAVGNIGAWNMFAGISAAAGLAQAHGAGLVDGVAGLGAGGAAGAAMVNVTMPAGSALGAAPVLASVGQAAPVGGLSVPGTWSAATPASSAAAATLTGSGWTAAAEEGGSVVPAGMPTAGMTGRGGLGFGAPRYGVKPIVMQRPTVVG